MSLSSFVTSVDLSPIRLSYAASLRGVKPRKTGSAFTYAHLSCNDANTLICLADSNPEGQFFGLLPTEAAAQTAQSEAAQRQVKNITFLSGSIGSLSVRSPGPLPSLDYLYCDATCDGISEADNAALLTLASQLVKPSGFFVYRYQAYPDVASILRGLVSELGPDMTVDQAKSFLRELKNLNPAFFEENPALKQSLNEAIARDIPDTFFGNLTAGSTALKSLDVMDQLLGLDFAYVSDAAIGANYLELSTTASAHPILLSCHEQPFYEAVKDFAMGRTERNDIWCRMPVVFGETPSELFGTFAFGIMTPRELVPPAITTFDRIVPLSSPLMTKIIDLMVNQPLSLGDFLAHPAGVNENPDQVLEAFQILVATGIAKPMRTGFMCEAPINMATPKWSTSYNNYLNDTPITTANVLLASTIVGNPVAVSARDALVLQALNRGGMSGSLDALIPELQRLTASPDLAATVLQDVDISPEGLRKMLVDTLRNQMPRWFAYGLLAA